MLSQFSSGPTLAVEIVSVVTDEDDEFEEVGEVFRQFCGSVDPQIARLLQPTSLRALYGSERVCFLLLWLFVYPLNGLGDECSSLHRSG